MKIASVKINNFRGYNEEVKIEFDNLTAIVGKNDVGKSTILEALDIFFNNGKGIIKLDKNDVNNVGQQNGNNEICIAVCFEDLPTNIIIDSSVTTSLEKEFLLNVHGQLEVIKKYSSSPSPKVYIKANHPQNPICSDLLSKKNKDLKKIISDNDIYCDNLSINSVMRRAIWNKFDNDLQLNECLIDITKEDAKAIWGNLQTYLPIYSLFQSDRKNSDSDNEVQDPLKEAVKQIITDPQIQENLSEIANTVRERIEEVSNRTLDKIKEMDPDIANSLKPVIPQSTDLKWQDVFKTVSISGDENIPINKRGSGVRRLILLNFFRAEAERRAENNDNANVVYAIEEPETSQHTNNQYKLIESFKKLSNSPKIQILLTTHSPNIVKKLEFKNLRLITECDGIKKIDSVKQASLKYPSLNEINYIAFNEITEEYHNDLYGFIESKNWLNEFKSDKPLKKYIKLYKKNEKELQLTLTEYIRHQIHHPENNKNSRFTHEELGQSIEMMRTFIESKRNESID